MDNEGSTSIDCLRPNIFIPFLFSESRSNVSRPNIESQYWNEKIMWIKNTVPIAIETVFLRAEFSAWFSLLRGRWLFTQNFACVNILPELRNHAPKHDDAFVQCFVNLVRVPERVNTPAIAVERIFGVFRVLIYNDANLPVSMDTHGIPDFDTSHKPSGI